MTLLKAIEILELNIKAAGNKMPPDVKDALHLHIEAAQRILVGRNNPGTRFSDLLPGETKE